jgi:hypothetical protein
MRSRVAVEAFSVLQDSMSTGLAGGVGGIAVLVGAIGLVYGLTRRRRQSLLARREERAVRTRS